MISPFESLGLPDDATPTQVRAAWRLKVFEPGIHPDRGGDAAELQKLKIAYEKALHVASNAPCIHCRGTGKVGEGGTSFVKTLMRCTACGGSGKRN